MYCPVFAGQYLLTKIQEMERQTGKTGEYDVLRKTMQSAPLAWMRSSAYGNLCAKAFLSALVGVGT